MLQALGSLFLSKSHRIVLLDRQYTHKLSRPRIIAHGAIFAFGQNNLDQTDVKTNWWSFICVVVVRDSCSSITSICVGS